LEKNTIYLVIVLVLIGGAIFYLNSVKAPVPSASPQQAAASGTNTKGTEDIYSPYLKAPELVGIKGYINAPDNLTIASLRGKVVLLDIWTYTCINCIRTLPYVESWHEKYAKDGLVVIGVHSPEFDFEKDYGNVLAAVKKFGITYPVVLDSDHVTWNAYQNQYWPRHYLIDANGRIRFDHIGEGGYDETEAQIVQLLSEAKHQNVPMNEALANAPSIDFGKVGTPELYFGNSLRRASLGNVPLFLSEGETFNATIPAGDLAPNVPYLDGSWTNNADNMQLASGSGAVELIFTAKNVNIVAGSTNSTNLTIYIDGKRVEKQDYCQDAPAGGCTVDMKRLYSIVVLPDYGTHHLRMEATGSGIQLFTFTFG